jgi:hypothetical protein
VKLLDRRKSVECMLEEFTRACPDVQICPNLTLVWIGPFRPNQWFGSNYFLVDVIAMRCSQNYEVKIEGEIILQPGSYQDTLQLQDPGKIWSVLGSDRPNYINPNTLLCHNGHETIVAEPWYGL